MNNVRTVLLLGLLTGLLLFFGSLFGQEGMTWALILAGAMNLGAYFWSHKIVLAMYRAKEIPETELPEVHGMVRDLALRAGLPKPRLYLIPSEAPNAFATGRNPAHAVVAVTSGTLRLLSKHELEGVLSHEMAHVRNRDILISSMAATIAGAIGYLAHMAQFAAMFGGMGRSDDDDGRGNAVTLILMAIIVPLIAMLIQMAVSRSREYQADAIGARLAGNPFGLADALEKLHGYSRRVPLAANPGTAHMFIVSPLTGGGWLSLLSTHPPIEQRIARLRSMTF